MHLLIKRCKLITKWNGLGVTKQAPRVARWLVLTPYIRYIHAHLFKATFWCSIICRNLIFHFILSNFLETKFYIRLMKLAPFILHLSLSLSLFLSISLSLSPSLSICHKKKPKIEILEFFPLHAWTHFSRKKISWKSIKNENIFCFCFQIFSVQKCKRRILVLWNRFSSKNFALNNFQINISLMQLLPASF